MSCNLKFTFEKVDHIGHPLFTSELETSLKGYLDWALLNAGGFTNITIPTSGAYGGSYDILRPVDDPAYDDGQVWESARKDWVWETGLCYSGISYSGTPVAVSPVQVTGVSVDGTIYGTGDATYGHHYNYPLGRVVFDSAISLSSIVKLEYSFRDVQVYIADNAPWWDEIQQESYRVDDPTYSQAGSGNWGILANHRVQLPAVIIEAVPRRSFTPYQMGDLSQFLYQDVLFHIIADTRMMRNQLIDAISLDKDKQIWTYNRTLVARSGEFPLDYRGMLIDASYDYPYLASTYPSKLCRYYNVTTTEMDTATSRLYLGTIRVTFETVYS